MITIHLDRDTKRSLLDEMDNWLSEQETGGYVGKGQAYITNYDMIKFYPLVHIPKEEDAIMFKLKFGV